MSESSSVLPSQMYGIYTPKIWELDTTGASQGWVNSFFLKITDARRIYLSKLTDTTDELDEGSTHLYFTIPRVRTSLSATNLISYDSGTGVINLSTGTITSLFSATNTTGTALTYSSGIYTLNPSNLPDLVQYLLVDGSRAMSGALNMNSQNINNVATITATNLAGTLTTASQPNITLVGTLSDFKTSDTTPTFSGLSTGIGHLDSSGVLSSSLIVNADVSASAGIVDTKLATISTSGKVSNSATTATSANTVSAIVSRDSSGNFSAGTITATLTGHSSLDLPLSGGTMSGAIDMNSQNITNANTITATSLAGTLTTASQPNITSVGILSDFKTSDTTPTFSGLSTGIGHLDSSGVLSSSLIVNADVSASAGIVDTKLATISTSGKVSNSATTATSANTVSAIVARDSSGVFACSGITGMTNQLLINQGTGSISTTQMLIKSTGSDYATVLSSPFLTLGHSQQVGDYNTITKYRLKVDRDIANAGSCAFRMMSVSQSSYSSPYSDTVDASYLKCQEVDPQLANTSFGYQAGNLLNSSSYSNVLLGHTVGRVATSASKNVGVSDSCLYSLTTGLENTGVGYRSLYATTTNSYQTAIGAYALENSTQNSNVAIGAYASRNQTTASYGVSIGYGASYNNIAGASMTAVGYSAGYHQKGACNTFIGAFSGQGISGETADTTYYNTGVGYLSCAYLKAGVYHNTAVGFQAMKGHDSNYISGLNNTAMGAYAMTTLSTGYQNSGYGSYVFSNLSTGDRNAGFGAYCMYQASTAILNSGFGNECLPALSTGLANCSFGCFSSRLLTTGSNNTNVGYTAGYTNSASDYNTNIGYSSNYWGTGAYNTAVGAFALTNLSTGTENIGIGPFAGSNLSTGSRNICIGYDSQPSSASVNYTITIGSSAYTDVKLWGILNKPELTASKICMTDSSKNIVSATTGNSLSISSTTIDTIQDIRTSASPSFSGLTISGAVSAIRYTAPSPAYNWVLSNSSAITTGISNFIQGVNAGYSLTTGRYNIFQGYVAGESFVSGYYNILLGYLVGTLNSAHNTFSDCIWIGRELGASYMSDYAIDQSTIIGCVNTQKATIFGTLTLPSLSGTATLLACDANKCITQTTSGLSPTFTGLNLSGLTVSSLVATDGSKNLTSSVSGLSPGFTGLNLSGLTVSSLVATDGSKNLISMPKSAGGTYSYDYSTNSAWPDYGTNTLNISINRTTYTTITGLTLDPTPPSALMTGSGSVFTCVYTGYYICSYNMSYVMSSGYSISTALFLNTTCMTNTRFRHSFETSNSISATASANVIQYWSAGETMQLKAIISTTDGTTPQDIKISSLNFTVVFLNA